MKYLIILLFFNVPISHDIQVAFFKILQENEKLSITVVMEKDDIESTFNTLDLSLTDNNLQDYLNKNLSLLINNKRQDCSLESVHEKNKHITVTFSANEVKRIKTLELNNTCFLNLEDHSNIIEIRVDESQRDFLMNKDRTTINVKY